MTVNLNNPEEQATLQTLMSVALEMSERLGVLEQKMNSIPHDRHNEEHEYLRVEIERKKAERDFWLDIRKRLATAGIISAMGLLATALWYGFAQWIKALGTGS